MEDNKELLGITEFRAKIKNLGMIFVTFASNTKSGRTRFLSLKQQPTATPGRDWYTLSGIAMQLVTLPLALRIWEPVLAIWLENCLASISTILC